MVIPFTPRVPFILVFPELSITENCGKSSSPTSPIFRLSLSVVTPVTSNSSDRVVFLSTDRVLLIDAVPNISVFPILSTLKTSIVSVGTSSRLKYAKASEPPSPM